MTRCMEDFCSVVSVKSSPHVTQGQRVSVRRCHSLCLMDSISPRPGPGTCLGCRRDGASITLNRMSSRADCGSVSAGEEAETIRQLIAVGEEKGYLLREEIDAVLPPATSASLDDLLSQSRDAGIDIDLRQRCGIADGHERTLEEVGRIFGLTRERIRQVQARAMQKLRSPSRKRRLELRALVDG